MKTGRKKKRKKQKQRKYPVTIAGRTHLYPYRTQKLSFPTLKILGGRPPGNIGSCRNTTDTFTYRSFLICVIQIFKYLTKRAACPKAIARADSRRLRRFSLLYLIQIKIVIIAYALLNFHIDQPYRYFLLILIFLLKCFLHAISVYIQFLI